MSIRVGEYELDEATLDFLDELLTRTAYGAAARGEECSRWQRADRKYWRLAHMWTVGLRDQLRELAARHG